MVVEVGIDFGVSTFEADGLAVGAIVAVTGGIGAEKWLGVWFVLGDLKNRTPPKNITVVASVVITIVFL
jgi:hypothetical protein